MSCAICGIRKERRFCPAVHGRICPQCCGENREVTLDCPLDCHYLRQAREHEKPRSADEIDPASLFLQVEVPEAFIYEKEHLLMGRTGIEPDRAPVRAINTRINCELRRRNSRSNRPELLLSQDRPPSTRTRGVDHQHRHVDRSSGLRSYTPLIGARFQGCKVPRLQ